MANNPINLILNYKNNKKTFKNNKGVRRDIKTEKAQEQDRDGTLATKLNTTSTQLTYVQRKPKHKEVILMWEWC